MELSNTLLVWLNEKLNRTLRVVTIISFVFVTTCLVAQNDVIAPMSIGTTASLLSNDKVNNIRILSSTDEILNIEIRYEGYNEEGTRYIISGSVLDGKKQAIKAITSDPIELSRNAEAVDLSFSMAGNIQSSTPYIESGYISISIQERSVEEDDEGDLLDDITKLLGGGDDPSGLGGALSDSYLFNYPKTWRVAGNENMVIDVNLIPIGKASK